MYETLITAFDGMEDWQPMYHKDFEEFHKDIVVEQSILNRNYMDELFTVQKENCTRFLNQEINEAGISKADLDELEAANLIPAI